MKEPSGRLVAGLGTIGIGLAVLVVLSEDGGSRALAKGEAQEVLVVNDKATPVAIYGAVSANLVGTPNVTLEDAQTPPLAGGCHAGARPVLTLDAQCSQPIVLEIGVAGDGTLTPPGGWAERRTNFGSGAQSTDYAHRFLVPAGKRLEIRHCSAMMTGNVFAQPLDFSLWVEEPSGPGRQAGGLTWLPLQHVANIPALDGAVYGFNGPQLIDAGEGAAILLNWRATATGSVNVHVTLTGHLVDVH